MYRRVLESVPNHPDALHYAGVLAHQQGRSDEAVALIEKSLASRRSGRIATATSASSTSRRAGSRRRSTPIERAIAIDPGHANAHSNLGVLLRATGNRLEAETAYRTAIRLNPEHIDAYTNLGILLNGLKRTEGGRRVLLQGDHAQAEAPGSARLLALAHCTLGEIDEAVNIFEEWLEEEPDDPIALHMRPPARVATCRRARRTDTSRGRSTASPPASRRSSTQLVVPRAGAVAAMLEESGVERVRSSSTCSTPAAARDSAVRCWRRMRGAWSASISPRACWRGRRRRVYDTLEQSELTEYLGDNRERSI